MTDCASAPKSTPNSRVRSASRKRTGGSSVSSAIALLVIAAERSPAAEGQVPARTGGRRAAGCRIEINVDYGLWLWATERYSGDVPGSSSPRATGWDLY